jgi:hypothetical protein
MPPRVRTNSLLSEYRVDQTAPSFGSSSMARATAIVGLVAVAVIHFEQIVPTMEQTPLLGVAFLALVAACLILGGRLLLTGSRSVWLAVAALNTLAVAGYAFTRMFSTVLDNQDVGNWSQMSGLGALLIEGLLVALSVSAVMIRVPLPEPSVAAPIREAQDRQRADSLSDSLADSFGGRSLA